MSQATDDDAGDEDGPAFSTRRKETRRDMCVSATPASSMWAAPTAVMQTPAPTNASPTVATPAVETAAALPMPGPAAKPQVSNRPSRRAATPKAMTQPGCDRWLCDIRSCDSWGSFPDNLPRKMQKSLGRNKLVAFSKIAKLASLADAVKELSKLNGGKTIARTDLTKCLTIFEQRCYTQIQESPRTTGDDTSGDDGREKAHRHGGSRGRSYGEEQEQDANDQSCREDSQVSKRGDDQAVEQEQVQAREQQDGQHPERLDPAHEESLEPGHVPSPRSVRETDSPATSTPRVRQRQHVIEDAVQASQEAFDRRNTHSEHSLSFDESTGSLTPTRPTKRARITSHDCPTPRQSSCYSPESIPQTTSPGDLDNGEALHPHPQNADAVAYDTDDLVPISAADLIRTLSRSRQRHQLANVYWLDRADMAQVKDALATIRSAVVPAFGQCVTLYSAAKERHMRIPQLRAQVEILSAIHEATTMKLNRALRREQELEAERHDSEAADEQLPSLLSTIQRLIDELQKVTESKENASRTLQDAETAVARDRKNGQEQVAFLNELLGTLRSFAAEVEETQEGLNLYRW